MKYLIILSLLSVVDITTTIAQRTMEVVPHATTSPFSAITLDNKAYFIERGNNFLSSYDGLHINRINFPVRDGIPLMYNWRSYHLVAGNFLYIALANADGDKFLYRFDGSSFHPIHLTGELEYPLIAFQEKLYGIIKVDGQKKLFSYDETSVLIIPSTEAPSGSEYELYVANQYLYAAIGDDTVIRFDGSHIVTLPYFEFPEGITHIEAVDGTDEVYILIWNSRIIHYDGASITEVFREPDDRLHFFVSFLTWDNKLYFKMRDSRPVFEYDGSSVSELVLPEGATAVPGSNILVYRDQLYIPATLPDGSSWIYSYNGSTFDRDFELPATSNNCYSFIREGNYVIIPETRGNTAFEFDGTDYTAINAPGDKDIIKFLTSTSCFHLWKTSDADAGLEIAKENKTCPTAIIPEGLRHFDHVEFGINGKYRDWCWTDIIWDWKIDPVCLIPGNCPPSVFGVSMRDHKGNEAWVKQFDTPFQTQFPLKDDQPYTMVLSSVGDNHPENIFILDDDLVSMGISNINIHMAPKNNYFLLAVETDKDEQVPFKMSLLNEEGKVIWEEKFTAPTQKEIMALVDKPGTTLQFSSLKKNNKELEHYGITNVELYPNPSKGDLIVDIKTNRKKVNVHLTISDLQGQLVIKEKITAPIQHLLKMHNQDPGIYILTLRVGAAKMSEQVQLEY